MAFSRHVWEQLKSKTADELIGKLNRDGYEKDPSSRDATIAYLKKISKRNREGDHSLSPQKKLTGLDC